MRPPDIVNGDPVGDLGAGVVEIEEQGFIEPFIAHPAIEALGKPFGIGFPGAMKCHSMSESLLQANMAIEGELLACRVARRSPSERGRRAVLRATYIVAPRHGALNNLLRLKPTLCGLANVFVQIVYRSLIVRRDRDDPTPCSTPIEPVGDNVEIG